MVVKTKKVASELIVNKTENLRVCVTKYTAKNQKEYLSFRDWYLKDEEWLPGKNGITYPWDLAGEFCKSLCLFVENLNHVHKDK